MSRLKNPVDRDPWPVVILLAGLFLLTVRIALELRFTSELVVFVSGAIAISAGWLCDRIQKHHWEAFLEGPAYVAFLISIAAGLLSICTAWYIGYLSHSL